jgi:polyribonucleotide nucleotidyltransferase
MGRVVNITKFGAFVNILPGRDGLVHISKLGGGKRIDRVEDVVDLGDEIEVRVEDVDPNGKISLTPVAGLEAREGASSGGSGGDAGGEASNGGAPREFVSFEDSFDDELRSELGELGPEAARPPRDSDGGRRSGGAGRGPRSGGGGGGGRGRSGGGGGRR